MRLTKFDKFVGKLLLTILYILVFKVGLSAQEVYEECIVEYKEMCDGNFQEKT